MSEDLELWEVLVPARDREDMEIPVAYHRLWDEKVRAITGGLTILHKARGQWLDERSRLVAEPMIPVRVAATEEQVDQVIALVFEHYDQDAVMAYRVSDRVIIRQRDT